MTEYKVPYVGERLEGRSFSVAVPGSKSITNRALLLAAMGRGKSVLRGCQSSEDATHFLECIKALGFPVEDVREDTPAKQISGVMGKDIVITGFGGEVPNKKATLYVGSAGTAARFLSAMLAFSDGEYEMNASPQMMRRPMEPLIEALREAGAEVVCTGEEGHFPLKIKGNGGVAPKALHINIDSSSQFLSGLMIAAGALKEDVRIEVSGSHGLAYVDMTARMMQDFGVETECVTEPLCYTVHGRDGYKARAYDIEPDLSAAAYFYALAGITGATVEVKGVHRPMLQGDMEFLEILQRMGCREVSKTQTIRLQGPEGGRLKGGFQVDMGACSDQALTLAAIAPFAEGPITITGIAHIRGQECDRIAAMEENLKALGIVVETGEGHITIYPEKLNVGHTEKRPLSDEEEYESTTMISDGAEHHDTLRMIGEEVHNGSKLLSGISDTSIRPHGARLRTFEDHRVAMSFALTGLRIPGVVILDPECCRKTFAEYFTVLDRVIREP